MATDAQRKAAQVARDKMAQLPGTRDIDRLLACAMRDYIVRKHGGDLDAIPSGPLKTVISRALRLARKEFDIKHPGFKARFCSRLGDGGHRVPRFDPRG